MSFKSIPTEYKGIRYRSRTEARWAVFFNEARIPFDYEPEGFEMDGMRYLPDFWLPVAKCWFEVKPGDPTPIEIEKARRLAHGTGRLVFIAPGSPRAEIGLHVISPTGRVKAGWQFAYAHEEGVGYICDNLWNYEMKVRIADVTAHPGMYGVGPLAELKAAAEHQFPWEPKQRTIEVPKGRILDVPKCRTAWMKRFPS